MTDLSGFPGAEILFTSDGGVDGSDAAALALAADPGVTDLLLLAHGWNNDAAGARDLFAAIAQSLRAVLDGGHGALPDTRRLGIVGVIWPSKQFTLPAGVAGPAAAAGSPVTTQDVTDRVDALRPIFPDEGKVLDEAAALVPHLPTATSARRAFVEHVRGLLTPDSADAAEGPAALFALPGETVLQRLSVPATLPLPGGGGPAAALGAGPGHAAGLPGLLGGILGGAANLLNFATFYAMKERAGLIGTAGLGPLVDRIAHARPTGAPALRLHLAGHSFGARVVSAATKALPAGRTISTMSLLQGAFSHFGFAADWDTGTPGGQEGFFRVDVAGARVTGPLLVTHTANDIAVGIAYAVASRIANQVAAGVGGPDDIFGGLGRNGAQRTDEAVTARLLAVGGAYQWQAGRPHNLLADEFIKGHSDVTGQQVAYAMLSAMSAG